MYQTVFNDYLLWGHDVQRLADVALGPEVHQTGASQTWKVPSQILGMGYRTWFGGTSDQSGAPEKCKCLAKFFMKGAMARGLFRI